MRKTSPLAVLSQFFKLPSREPSVTEDKTSSKPKSNTPAVVSNSFMAAMFLSCWIWPNWMNEGQVQYLSLLTLLEIMMVMLMFFLVPLILIDLDRKLQRFIIGFLFFFFGIFVVGMSVGIGEYMVIFFFAYAIFNKVLVIRRLRQATSLPWAIGIDWVGSVVVLFITAVIAFGVPMPEFGLTDGSAYFNKQPAADLNMSVEFGAYEKEPQQAMAFGVVFYSLQALAQKLKSKLAEKRVSI